MAIPHSIVDFRSGIAGTMSHSGPIRAMAALLNSGSEANNVFGRAFTRKTDGTVEAGGAGVFAGVMVNPHANAIDQTTARNGTTGEFVHMGEVFATVAGTPAVGGKVYFIPATGALTTVSTDNTEIKGAVIVRHDPDQNLCVVSLTGLTV